MNRHCFNQHVHTKSATPSLSPVPTHAAVTSFYYCMIITLHPPPRLARRPHPDQLRGFPRPREAVLA